MSRVDGGRPGSAGPRASRRRSVPPARAILVVAAALAALGTAGCDDQVKYVETFSTMTEQEAVQTYEAPPRSPVEGTVPVTGTAPRYTVQAADTALTNPLQPTANTIERGGTLYRNFCLPCHGETGTGDGPVMNVSGDNPGRFPSLPTADLTAERVRGLSDGHIWGVIANGIRIMPAYARIEPEDRWYVVEYVRYLQQEAMAGSGAGTQAQQSAEAPEDQ